MKILSVKEYEELAKNPEVEEIQYNGISSLNPKYLWHTVFTVEGKEYDIYVNRYDF